MSWEGRNPLRFHTFPKTEPTTDRMGRSLGRVKVLVMFCLAPTLSFLYAFFASGYAGMLAAPTAAAAAAFDNDDDDGDWCGGEARGNGYKSHRTPNIVRRMVRSNRFEGTYFLQGKGARNGASLQFLRCSNKSLPFSAYFDVVLGTAVLVYVRRRTPVANGKIEHQHYIWINQPTERERVCVEWWACAAAYGQSYKLVCYNVYRRLVDVLATRNRELIELLVVHFGSDWWDVWHLVRRAICRSRVEYAINGPF